MYVIITIEDFRKLVPDITDFKFNQTLKKVGLRYMHMLHRENLLKNKSFPLPNRYEYQLEVIDEQVFLLNTIKCGIQPKIIVDEQ